MSEDSGYREKVRGKDREIERCVCVGGVGGRHADKLW